MTDSSYALEKNAFQKKKLSEQQNILLHKFDKPLTTDKNAMKYILTSIL